MKFQIDDGASWVLSILCQQVHIQYKFSYLARLYGLAIYRSGIVSYYMWKSCKVLPVGPTRILWVGLPE